MGLPSTWQHASCPGQQWLSLGQASCSTSTAPTRREGGGQDLNSKMIAHKSTAPTCRTDSQSHLAHSHIGVGPRLSSSAGVRHAFVPPRVQAPCSLTPPTSCHRYRTRSHCPLHSTQFTPADSHLPPAHRPVQAVCLTQARPLSGLPTDLGHRVVSAGAGAAEA